MKTPYDSGIFSEVQAGLTAQLWADRETGRLAILASSDDFRKVVEQRRAGVWAAGGELVVEVRDRRIVAEVRNVNVAGDEQSG